MEENRKVTAEDTHSSESLQKGNTFIPIPKETSGKANPLLGEEKYTDADGFSTPPDHLHFRAKKLFGRGGEIEGGAIAYLQPGGGGPQTPHTHPHDHLFIVVSGEAKVMLGEEVKTIRPNEAFRVKGSIPHSVWNAALEEVTVMIGITLKAD